MPIKNLFITIPHRPNMRKAAPKFKPIPFRVVKKVVIEDFDKYADRFSDHAKRCYLSEFKRTNNIPSLLRIMAGTKDRSINEAMELLLDLLNKE